MEPKLVVPLLIQVSTMLIIFSIGLQGRWSDIGYGFRRPRLLLCGFAAVYVAVPLTAFIAAMLLPIDTAGKIGIVAMALSPLAPLAPGKMLQAGADTSYVIGVYIGLLMFATITVPATLLIVTTVTGGSASIGVGAVTWLIVHSILLPLAIGICLGTLAPAAAPPLSKITSVIGHLALAILMAMILITVSDRIVALIGNGTLLAIVMAELAGLATGHVLGGPVPEQRIALAQAAAARHPGLAVLMVQQSFDERSTILAGMLLYLLVGMLVSALYVLWARKRS